MSIRDVCRAILQSRQTSFVLGCLRQCLSLMQIIPPHPSILCDLTSEVAVGRDVNEAAATAAL